MIIISVDEDKIGKIKAINSGIPQEVLGSCLKTPIINQEFLVLWAVRKVPDVIETSEGDFIGIRHKMFHLHSYYHRVVYGA